MKKYIIGSITILIIFCSILAIKVHMTGTKQQIMGASLISLEVPKLSLLSEETGEYVAKFNSFRSMKSLEKEFNNMYLDYKKCFKDENIYYYDKNNNITITNYQIGRGLFLNNFTIYYEKGNACK